MAKKNYWIPRKKHGRGGLKKGALSRQLGIPEPQNIPMELLEDIKRAQVGVILKNRHGIGKREIIITKLLKKRANFAHTLKRIGKGRRY